MGRNNTKAVKNIGKMYEQLGLVQDDIFYKTKLLLSIYRDVVWATLSDCNCVNEEIYYYGDDLNEALVYLEEFAPNIERSEFERRVCNLFENKWMIDLIDKAMSKVYDYYNNGKLYHEILSKSYLTAFRYTESELLEILNLERSTFYDRKKEAVMLLGIALCGYASRRSVASLIQEAMRYPNSLSIQKSPTFVRRKSDENPTDFLLKVRLHLCYTVYAAELHPLFDSGRKMAGKWHSRCR